MIAEHWTVIGGRGAIGRALVQELERQGANVTVFDPRKDPCPSDDTQRYVIYAAGVTADFRSRPAAAVQAHCGTLARLFEAMHCASFVYLSSTRVYLHAASTAESAPLTVEPLSLDAVYNASKLAGETLTLHASPSPRAHVARISNVCVYKPGSQDFLSSLIDEALQQGHVRLRSPGSLARDYIAMDDVIRYLIAIAREGREPIYNVASGMNLSSEEIIRIVTDETGATSELPVETGVVTPRFRQIDTTLIEQAFGPVQISPRDAIHSVVRKAASDR